MSEIAHNIKKDFFFFGANGHNHLYIKLDLHAIYSPGIKSDPYYFH